MNSKTSEELASLMDIVLPGGVRLGTSWRGLQSDASTPDDSRLNTPETTPPSIPTNSAMGPALTIGIIRFDPVAMVGAIAVVIGGTVVFGSNTSTLKQIAVAIQNAEALRAELIGKINLRVVPEQTQS